MFFITPPKRRPGLDPPPPARCVSDFHLLRSTPNIHLLRGGSELSTLHQRVAAHDLRQVRRLYEQTTLPQRVAAPVEV